MERLKYMKHKLTECVEKQISENLECTNAQELGEAVDMIKDLSEAIYYCTITEAMEEKSPMRSEGHYPAAHYYGDTQMRKYPVHTNGHEVSYYTPIAYSQNGGHVSGDTRYYSPMYHGGPSTNMYEYPEYMYPPMNVDYDGRSYVMRRKYMDGKRYNSKEMQMQELEKYTQELASDLTDMVKDASPEEKAMLQQKIQMLASKIK